MIFSVVTGEDIAAIQKSPVLRPYWDLSIEDGSWKGVARGYKEGDELITIKSERRSIGADKCRLVSNPLTILLDDSAFNEAGAGGVNVDWLHRYKQPLFDMILNNSELRPDEYNGFLDDWRGLPTFNYESSSLRLGVPVSRQRNNLITGDKGTFVLMQVVPLAVEMDPAGVLRENQ